MEQVIDTCGITEGYGAFSERVAVETITDTRIIAITVTDEEPAIAQFIANEIRKVASEHIKNVMDIQAVNVAEEANLPDAPASPNVMKWTGGGLLLGIFLCAMILIIRFLVDDTIKTSDDVEKYLGLSTLAMIPVMDTEGGKRRHRRKEPDIESVEHNRTEESDAESRGHEELVVEEWDKGQDVGEAK